MNLNTQKLTKQFSTEVVFIMNLECDFTKIQLIMNRTFIILCTTGLSHWQVKPPAISKISKVEILQ